MHKFRDTLFKRYSEVSFLLSTMRWEVVPDFVTTLFDEELNDKLWTIYLSNPYRAGSFNDFKQKAMDSNKSKEQVESEAQKAAKNALNMLDNIGGDSFGI